MTYIKAIALLPLQKWDAPKISALQCEFMRQYDKTASFKDYTMSDPTQLTSEEIQQYRDQLKGYPQYLEDIDFIERCDGDLEYTVIRLVRRANIDTVREDEDKLWQKVIMEARSIVCQDGIKDNLAPNILGGLIGLFIASSSSVLGVVATPLAIYIVEETLEDFCDTKSVE